LGQRRDAREIRDHCPAHRTAQTRDRAALFPGTGHNPLLEAPVQIAALIDAAGCPRIDIETAAGHASLSFETDSFGLGTPEK
jgi:hypothetical protein